MNYQPTELLTYPRMAQTLNSLVDEDEQICILTDHVLQKEKANRNLTHTFFGLRLIHTCSSSLQILQ